MNDEKDNPKYQPEDDWAMTTPNLSLPEEIKTERTFERSSPQQASDDWSMTEPNVKIPQNLSPEDFGKTAPNLSRSDFEEPAAPQTPPTTTQNSSSEDWMMSAPNVKIPKEQKSDGWEMPKPVFRVSSGTDFTPTAPQDQSDFEKTSPDADFSSESISPQAAAGDGKTSPYFRLDEKAQEKTESAFGSKAPQPVVPPPVAAPARKSSKLPLIIGGLFVMFFTAAVFLAGVYFLFLRRTEPLQVLNAPKTNTVPNSEPAPVSNSNSAAPNLPASVDYKGEMVLVSAGEFTMGSDAGEDVSKPAYPVTLPAFYIDKYEVTNAQYKEFCDATGKSYPNNQYWNQSYFLSRPQAPVVGISFADAQAYAAWTGKRLPTEEEWEKAASWDEAAKAKREFPWGNDFAADKAAFNLSEPSDVGKYASGASPSGAMDMAGNVLEWVDAYFKPYPNSRAVSEEFGEKNRVVRGGYFGSKGNDRLKTTKRIYVPPVFIAEGETASYIGFRCAISADDPRLKDLLAAQSK